MSNIFTIQHSSSQGTLIEGTSQGDDSNDILRNEGWRWGHGISLWYVPHSRDRAPKREIIERTAAALRAAGHQVHTDIDATPRAAEAIETDFTQNATAREQKYTARSDRYQAFSDDARASADRLSRRFAGGQPILIGHHSQGGAERDHQRMTTQLNKAIDQREAARNAAGQAQTAAASVGARVNPVTVANRIERLTTHTTKLRKRLTFQDPTGNDPKLLHQREDLAHCQNALEHWQHVRQLQLEDGTATNYGPETVTAGDVVKICGVWRLVARANMKSVSVHTGYSWTDRIPWHKVQDHCPAAAK